MSTMPKADGPATNSFPGYWDSTSLIVVVCSAIAGYNAIELSLLIFSTFHRYKGLYFWSLVVATSGIIPYVIGLLMWYFEWTYKLAGYIVNNYGWWTMVTGQSVVLYSRLGVVLGQGYEKLLRFVLWMIIIDGLLFHTTTTIVNLCSHYAPHPKPFAEAYRYVEKIQMTGFCIQEFIISGIYIWKTVEVLQAGSKKHTHRIMFQLFLINVIIVVMDIGLLVLEYKDLFIPEVAFKELFYSVKLKLEFAILSKLVEVSSTGQRRVSHFFGDTTALDVDSGAGRADLQSTPSPLLRTTTTQPLWSHDVEKSGELNGGFGLPSTQLGESSLDAKSHRFDSVPTIESRLDDSNPDLMYADAMRIISKT